MVPEPIEPASFLFFVVLVVVILFLHEQRLRNRPRSNYGWRLLPEVRGEEVGVHDVTVDMTALIPHVNYEVAVPRIIDNTTRMPSLRGIDVKLRLLTRRELSVLQGGRRNLRRRFLCLEVPGLLRRPRAADCLDADEAATTNTC